MSMCVVWCGQIYLLTSERTRCVCMLGGWMETWTTGVGLSEQRFMILLLIRLCSRYGMFFVPRLPIMGTVGKCLWFHNCMCECIHTYISQGFWLDTFLVTRV